MSRRPSHRKWGGLGLSPQESARLVREDQRRTEPPASPRERARARLRDAVHDVFALEAAAASRVGEPATEAVCHAPLPVEDPPSQWALMGPEVVPPEDEGLGLRRRSRPRKGRYPFRLGLQAMERRREWLEEHGERLRELENGA